MRLLLASASLLFLAAITASADDGRPPLNITRARAAIVVDGDLSDAAWKDALRIDDWIEFRPAENEPSKLKNSGWITYDDHFFYVAFDFEDPDPRRIRAPYGDHDDISGTGTDFAGVLVNTRADEKTATEFLATPRGVHFDAVLDDSAGIEDASPDFFWDSATRITATGWQMEIRIPFSQLRYDNPNPASWGIMLYRNYPRERRYQIATNPIDRNKQGFVANFRRFTGLSALPSGGHIVAAPYVASSARQEAAEIGDPLGERDYETDIGADVKWTPNADTAIDLALNPDFSQVESDVAEITANERFAIFYPEKRPFFLEGVELLSTPIQAVYTRTITSPRWGARGTGQFGKTSYTLLVADDRGGGSVVIPGPLGSDFADQNFESTVAIARLRHDLGGNSFVSMLATGRDQDGSPYNAVIGPDFQWRPTEMDTVTGQFLVSSTVEPDRPDEYEGWNGETLRGYAANLWYSHRSRTYDWYAEYNDRDHEFRADTGFVPEVGTRSLYGEAGYTRFPKGFLHRLRLYLIASDEEEIGGMTTFQQISTGFGGDGKWGSFWRFRVAREKVQSDAQLFEQDRLYYQVDMSPTSYLTNVGFLGWVGEGVDYAESRPADGADLEFGGTIRAGNHLNIRIDGGLRWLDVDDGRLFTAQAQRLKATYTFNERAFVRGIVQHVRTDRDDALYEDDVDERTGGVASSILFAYKLNWQSVLFVGYGDDQALDDRDDLATTGRQVFLKISYAFQR